MKNKFTYFKLLAAAGLLSAGVSARAQQINAPADFPTAPAATYCNASTVKLSATSSGAATFSWKRYEGTNTSTTATSFGETSANLNDATVTAGYYTYVSTSFNADNCESVVSDPITVYVLPAITATIASSDAGLAQYCTSAVPTTLTLTATPGEAQSVPESFGYTYQWLKNGNPITGATGPAYALTTAADAAVGVMAYTVRVNYQVKACTDAVSNAVSLTVIALPAKPTITIIP